MGDREPLRLLHVGCGALGRQIADDFEMRGMGQILGRVDPRVDGCLQSLADFHEWDNVDCVLVTTVSELTECAPMFTELMERGQTVVSTCEELSWPWMRHPEISEQLHAIARRHGGRLLGTGVNPGFLMDIFPVMVSRVCRRIDRVKVYRIQDASDRRIPFQKKIGAGLSHEEFDSRVIKGELRHVGLPESMHFLANYLDLNIDSWCEILIPVEDQDGAIVGVRQVGRALRGEDCVIELHFEAGLGVKDPHDRVVIEGDRPVDVTWKGGVHGDVATSSVTLSSIRPLMASSAGLHTMATIPISAQGLRIRRSGLTTAPPPQRP